MAAIKRRRHFPHRLAPIAERMAFHTDSSGGPDACWPWLGTKALARRGYGVVQIEGRQFKAHRIAWEIANGRKVRPGLFICHHCDNPPCVNPRHLFEGSPADNSRDRSKKKRGRRQDGELNHAAKMTKETAVAIYAAAGRRREIAARFGVKPERVSRIKLGRSWQSATGATVASRLWKREKRAH